MKRKFFGITILMCICLVLMGQSCQTRNVEAKREAEKVNRQQSQYAKGQPVPGFDWSLERHLMIELYKLRNMKVTTHAVWRSDYGMIEYDCPSLGYGLPYDVSLTNPLVAIGDSYHSITAIEQAEPNGIFASKNTSATWVMCVGDAGSLEPVYIESKVTIFPWPVKVDYKTNRVRKSGKATVTISNK